MDFILNTFVLSRNKLAASAVQSEPFDQSQMLHPDRLLGSQVIFLFHSC